MTGYRLASLSSPVFCRALLLGFSLPSFECLIVETGSIDESTEVLAE